MSIPQPRIKYPSMDELYNSHRHLYTSDREGQRRLKWERLWDTTGRDYGRFAIRQSSKGRDSTARNKLFSRHLTSSSLAQLDDIKEEKYIASKPTSPNRYELLSSASVDVLTLDEHSPSLSPSASQEKNVPERQHYGLRKPGSKITEPIIPPTRIEQHTNGFTRGLSAVDRSRPNMTSGHAKRYVTSTQSILWDNLESMGC